MLEAALAYARADIPVFPCGLNKRPIGSLVPHGHLQATTNEKTIRSWWAKNPDAWIGMPTGKRSGFSIYDLDKKKGKNGFKHLPDWKKRSALIVITPSGGSHLWFSDPEGKVPCSSDQIAKGIDTRGEGGYVIVPPSNEYKWLNGHDLSKAIAWPDDLLPPQAVKPKRSRRIKNTEPAEPERVRRALAVIPSDAYDKNDKEVGWYRVAGALYNEFGERGFPIFEEWSKKSPKYDWKTCERKWNDM
jgi:Bifunctional DNA primase/polymerase, N-terminal/Primase C terminal 2 (PriCT-2)